MSEKKTCRKVKFTDENSATFTLKKITENSTLNKKPQRAYLCKICSSWHLTSKPDISSLQDELNNLKQENEQLKKKIKDDNYKKELELKYKIKRDTELKKLKNANFSLAKKLTEQRVKININDVKRVAYKVWTDMFNNDTLTFNTFEDYFQYNLKQFLN